MKNNYLGNLPSRNYDLSKGPYNRYQNYIIENLLDSEYKTNDPLLKNFKDAFAGLMIRKISNGYDLNKYFTIRNSLVQIPEKIIHDLHDELILAINYSDEDNLKIMTSLTEMHDFKFLSKRVKTKTGYTVQTRELNLGDLYQGITYLSAEMDSFIFSYIKRIATNITNLADLIILRDMLLESDTMAYYKKFDEQFIKFKDCKVTIYEKLYYIFRNQLKEKLIHRLNQEINKFGINEEKNKDAAYVSYATELLLKKSLNK